MLLWMTITACGGATLVGVSSTEPLAGDPLTLHGTGLHRGLSAEITHTATGTSQIVPLRQVTASQANLDLPETLEPGSYTVSLVSDGWTQPNGQQRIDLWHPDHEPACHKRYALRTETSRLSRTIGVDRIIPGHPTEKLRFGPDDYRQLRYSVEHDSESPCISLWLDTTDGRSVLIADDTQAVLATRAAQMGRVLGVPVEGLPAE